MVCAIQAPTSSWPGTVHAAASAASVPPGGLQTSRTRTGADRGLFRLGLEQTARVRLSPREAELACSLMAAYRPCQLHGGPDVPRFSAFLGS